jgi:inorganic triphosphatase YgiF
VPSGIGGDDVTDSNQPNESQEIELKLQLLKPEMSSGLWQYSPVKNHLMSEPSTSLLVSTYYDTSDHHLLKQELSYRVRQKDDRWIATVKKMGQASGGLHQRGEWNSPLPDENPEPGLIEVQKIREQLQQSLGDKPLLPLMTTRFKRVQSDWQDDEENLVEIALDQGEIITERSNQPIRELELELKKGKPAALLKLGMTLAREFPMLPGNASKFFRGLQLLDLVSPDKTDGRVSDTRHDGVSGDAKLEEAVPKLIEAAFFEVVNALQHLTENPDEPEHTHQLRVKIRQLRSLVSFFKPILPEDAYVAFQADLREWGSKLSMLRELDVMKNHFGLFLQKFSAGSLQGYLDRELEIERHQLFDQIADGKMTPILLGTWHQIYCMAVCPEQSQVSLATYASDRMNQWVTRFERKGRQARAADIAQLHRLRIQGKKIRYVLEWIESIIPATSSKSVKVMKELQNTLGELHDIHCETLHMQEWITQDTATPDLMYQAGLYEGWQQQRQYNLQQELEKFWEKAVKKLPSS